MPDTITVNGLVATTPHSFTTAEGVQLCSFRLVTTQRRYDRESGSWSDGSSNWYSVSAFRSLAQNATASVAKGDRVVVCGRLRIRQWESGEKHGTSVDLEAEAIGHDLNWGTSTFTRSIERPRRREGRGVAESGEAAVEYGDEGADRAGAGRAGGDARRPDGSDGEAGTPGRAGDARGVDGARASEARGTGGSAVGGFGAGDGGGDDGGEESGWSRSGDALPF